MQNYFFQKGIQLALYAVVLFVVFFLIDFTFLSLIAFFAIFLILFAYRKRVLLKQPEANEIVFPVSGKIFSILPSDDENYETKIVIESSYFDNATMITPFDAKIEQIVKQYGAKLSKFSKLFKKLNQMVAVEFIQDEFSLKLVSRQKVSLFSLETYFNPYKKELKGGSVFGYGFNTQTMIYLPKNVQLTCEVDQIVEAGHNIIGYVDK